MQNNYFNWLIKPEEVKKHQYIDGASNEKVAEVNHTFSYFLMQVKMLNLFKLGPESEMYHLEVDKFVMV